MLRRAARWLLWSGSAMVALLIAAFMALPLWGGPLIARQASASLGRAVGVGRVHLALDAPVTVVAQDLVIGNPEGFPAEEEPFARVSRLAIQIDVAASLRHQQLVIASAEVDQPAIHAFETEDSRTNYRLPVESRTPIRSISIIDGRARVSLAPLRADLAIDFATKQHPADPDGPGIVGEAHGTYAGEPLTARFAARFPSGSPSSQPWAIETVIQNGPTRASLSGTVQTLFNLRGASLSVSIAGPDMARLRPLSGVPFPATPPYELNGKVDITADTYQVTGATGRVGRTAIDGMMTVATSPGHRPEIAGSVLSSSADLRDIASLLSGKPGPPGTPGQTSTQEGQALEAERKALANPKVLPQAPLHLAKLDRLNLHLNFRAQRVQGASMPFDDLAFRLDIVDGAVTVHPMSFGVGQGRIAGSIWLTPRDKDALWARADLRFERVDVGRLLWASGGYPGTGALNGAVRGEGSGRSIAEIVAGADGSVSLWMKGGNVSSLLVDLAGLRLGSALMSSLAGPSTTEVECFLADLPLRQGVLSTQTLLLETADAITEGRGSVDLRHERVEVRLRTQSRHLTVGVLPTPLLISGSLKHPQAAPDPATPAGQHGLLGALAMLPMVQLGTGEAPSCGRLLREAQNR